MTDMQHGGTQRTVLVDIEIPFWRIVAILIKWFLASIPALIVLSIIFAIIGAILAAIFGEGFRQWWMFQMR